MDNGPIIEFFTMYINIGAVGLLHVGHQENILEARM